MSTSMQKRRAVTFALVTLGVVAVGLATSRARRSTASGALPTTVGDLRTMHAEVTQRGKEVRGSARLAPGDDVTTGAAGRARVRLDDGTQIVVDGDTELHLEGSRLRLAKGRLFVQGSSSARTVVAFGDASTTVVSSSAAFEAKGSAKVYCARGELVLAAGGKTARVASGETATLAPGGPKVAPEAAFDDWTGGLATPWSGERGPKSAIPEVWAGPGGPDPGAPLVVRAAKVDVALEGEVAVTRMRTTYFNGSDRAAQADVRMALPAGAIVARVASLFEGAAEPLDATVGPTARKPGQEDVARLEWAGGGWLRGTLVGVPGGRSVDLLVDYVEWLPQQDGHATYRFPMASDSEAPMVGGLSVRVAPKGAARIVSASSDAVLRDGAIELRRADVRPTGDLVVELAPDAVARGAARAYVESGAGAADDPYVLVRTEVPEVSDSGVTFAVVVDTSMSMGASLLETERAVVDALLEALGPKDAVVVVAADQSARVVGPDKATGVTPEVRAAIRKGLADVRAGGASNLGAGLERAADLLDAQEKGRAGAGVVVYVGDGRPTVGETTARELRKRLARRAGGVPRLAAVAVGQGADRWMLAELVQGSGPAYEVLDRPEAARAGGALVADALAPTVRGVSLDLGPTVDRVYPREPRTVASGGTVSATGRLRGKLPTHVTLRYRRGTELVEESRPLALERSPEGADVAKRWAEDRVEEIAMRGEGLEGAVALAASAGLVTPWTSFFWSSGARWSMAWDDRVIALDPASDTAFAARIAPAPPPPSLLPEPPKLFDGEATLEQAAEVAARHTLRDALPALVACRDARAAVRPDVPSDLRVSVAIDSDGHTTKVVVEAVRGGGEDRPLGRCVRSVVGAVPFFGVGVSVTFTETLSLPPVQTTRRTQCSVTSTLPLPVKRGIWRARNAKHELDYAVAARQCELRTWSDRRALLAVLVTDLSIQDGAALAARLAASGEGDASAFVRQELLRRPNLTALAYADLRRLFVGDEPRLDVALDKAYRAATSTQDRMAVLRRFLRLAPHSPLGRRLLLALLESTGQSDALRAEIAHVRSDPFSDAGLLASGASLLRRLGDDAEGRRAFAELIERAPRDPWTLAYVGDRLRAEGLYEDALAAYERLDAAMPDDSAVALRLALAHAGSGRLDVAIRLLQRSAETGGRGDDGRTGELASILSATLLAGARQASPAPEVDALLARRLAETPLPDVASLLLVSTPPADDPVEVRVAQQEGQKADLAPDLDASSMGLVAVRVERGAGAARLLLRRTAALAGSRPVRVTVRALALASDRGQSRLVTREVDVDEKGVELRWNGEALR